MTHDQVQSEARKFGGKVKEYQKLSKSKKAALVHLLFSKNIVDNRNNVTTSLGEYNPTTIRDSVDELARDGYLVLEPWKGTIQRIILTMKGGAAAVVYTSTIKGTYSGVYRQLQAYTKRYYPKSANIYDAFNFKLSGEEQKDFFVLQAMTWVLEEDCFDDAGNEKISEEDKRRFTLKIADVGTRKYGKAKVGSREFFEKYGVTRPFTNEILHEFEKELVDARREFEASS